jgi:mono/diheme cytochrome c family protein
MKFLFGLILGLLITAAVGYGYFRFGYAPVATSSAPMPFENLTQGAAVYAQNCAFCHGAPGQKTTMAAKGMFPLPPQLFAKEEMVTDDPVGATYWKVSNGIRMTGMPGFAEMLTPTQIWQVSLLLANADKLPVQVQSALAPPAQLQNVKTDLKQPVADQQQKKKKN